MFRELLKYCVAWISISDSFFWMTSTQLLTTTCMQTFGQEMYLTRFASALGPEHFWQPRKLLPSFLLSLDYLNMRHRALVCNAKFEACSQSLDNDNLVLHVALFEIALLKMFSYPVCKGSWTLKFLDSPRLLAHEITHCFRERLARCISRASQGNTAFLCFCFNITVATITSFKFLQCLLSLNYSLREASNFIETLLTHSWGFDQAVTIASFPVPYERDNFPSCHYICE